MSAEPYSVPDRYTIAVDFDGVLHSYTSGWVAADAIPDPPIAGAIDWLNEVSQHYEIIILTTRARYPEAIPAVEAWLREHGFEGECVVTAEKGPALLYIDDRAWRFRGQFPTLQTIRYAKPWREGDAPSKSVKQKFSEKNKQIAEMERRLGERKAEIRALRRALLLEIVTNALATPEAAEAWMIATDGIEYRERLALARSAGVPS